MSWLVLHYMHMYNAHCQHDASESHKVHIVTGAIECFRVLSTCFTFVNGGVMEGLLTY